MCTHAHIPRTHRQTFERAEARPILLQLIKQPATQQQAVGLCHNIARLLNARQGENDWGADRLQVRLVADDFELLFNVEWLCEAVWLEPVGASTAHISKADMLQNVQLKLQQALEQVDL